MQEVLEPFLYEYTSERGGSISAEHGLGQMKNQYMGCAATSSYITFTRGSFDMMRNCAIMALHLVPQ